VRVVFDSNVVVSFLVTPSEPSAQLIALVRSGALELLVSEEIVEEYHRVIMYPKVVHRLAGEIQEAQPLVEQIVSIGIRIQSATGVRVVEADATDDKFIACAISGHARYIVSSDKHRVKLESYQGIRILKPYELLRLLAI
jgi:putative PIN family toxin of toxin-antitoxin system